MSRAAWLGLAMLYAACLLLAPAGALPDLALGPPLAPPSAAHPLGTDDLGRDMLAALAQGGRTSLAIGALAGSLALALGTAWGVGAAMAGGLAEALVMRAADVAASLPLLLLALLLAAAFGPDDVALAALVGLARAPLVARVARAEARAVLAAGYVRAARALGASGPVLLARHVLPNAAPAVCAMAAVVFGGAVLAEASLAFLGLGDPSVTSWGRLIAQGSAFAHAAPWLWAAPAAALALSAALVALAARIDDPAPAS